MDIPEPQNDELDLGLLGRIRIVNHIHSERETLDSLQRSFFTPNCEGPRHPPLLAQATRMQLAKFITKHTLAPFHFAFSDAPDMKHAESINYYLQNWYGSKRPIATANFCLICADDDLRTRGFSYWRRAHHLPGLNYCPAHNIRLTVADRLAPFSNMPHSYIEQSAIQTSVSQGNVVIRRYGNFCQQLLSREAPVNSSHLKRSLGRWISRMGLYSGNRGTSRSTLADVASQILPTKWLIQNFSGDYPRGGKYYLALINRTAKKFETVPAQHYALAMALIASPEAQEAARILVTERSM